jgi:hypothetical protein
LATSPETCADLPASSWPHALAGHWRGLSGAKFSALNVISSVARAQPVSGRLILYNSAYALVYATVAICGAVLVFERRNLK